MPHFFIKKMPVISQFPGVTHRFIINKETGATGVQLAEVVLQPGAALPLHYHDVDDAMFVVSGKGKFIEGDREVAVEPDMALLAPAMTKHTLRNDGDQPLKIIFVWPTVNEVKRFLV